MIDDIQANKNKFIELLETAKREGQRVEVEGAFYSGQGTTRRIGLVHSINSTNNTYILYGSASDGCLVLNDRETLSIEGSHKAWLIGPRPAPDQSFTIKIGDL